MSAPTPEQIAQYIIDRCPWRCGEHPQPDCSEPHHIVARAYLALRAELAAVIAELGIKEREAESAQITLEVAQAQRDPALGCDPGDVIRGMRAHIAGLEAHVLTLIHDLVEMTALHDDDHALVGKLNEVNVRLENERNAAVVVLQQLGNQEINDGEYRQCAWCGAMTDDSPEPEELIEHESDCPIDALRAKEPHETE